MFNGRERVASFVVRWSTTPRVKDQSVADHSFYVVLYTTHICDRLDITGQDRAECIEWAVYHDLPENVLGDFPGPVKRRLIDKDKLERLEAEVMNEMNLGAPNPALVPVMVVKIANTIDELFYLQNERNLGNKYVEDVFNNSRERFMAACIALDKYLGKDVLNLLRPLIFMFLDQMKHSVVTLKTSEDHPDDQIMPSGLSDDEIPF